MATPPPRPPYPLLYLTEIQRVWDGLVERQANIRKSLIDDEYNGGWSIDELRRILSQMMNNNQRALSPTMTKAEIIQQIIQRASRFNNYFIDDGCGRFLYKDQLSPEYRYVLGQSLEKEEEKKQGNVFGLNLDDNKQSCKQNESDLMDQWKTRVLANRIQQLSSSTAPLESPNKMVGMYYPAAKVQDMPEFAGRSDNNLEEWKLQNLPRLLTEARSIGISTGIRNSIAPVEEERKRLQSEFEIRFQTLDRERKQLQDEIKRITQSYSSQSALTIPIAQYQRCTNELKLLKDQEAKTIAAYTRFSAVDAERKKFQDLSERLQGEMNRDKKQTDMTIKQLQDENKRLNQLTQSRQAESTRLRAENTRLLRQIELSQSDEKALIQCRQENKNIQKQLEELKQCQSDRLRIENTSNEYKEGQERCTGDLQIIQSQLRESQERSNSLQTQVTILNQSTQLLQTQLRERQEKQIEMEAELKLLRQQEETAARSLPSRQQQRIIPPTTRSSTAATSAQFAQVERAYQELQNRVDVLSDANQQLEQQWRQAIAEHKNLQAESSATITDLQLQLQANERKAAVDQKAIATKLKSAEDQTNALRDTLAQLGPGLQLLIRELIQYYSSASSRGDERKPQRIQQIETFVNDMTSSPNDLFSNIVDLVEIS